MARLRRSAIRSAAPCESVLHGLRLPCDAVATRATQRKAGGRGTIAIISQRRGSVGSTLGAVVCTSHCWGIITHPANYQPALSNGNCWTRCPSCSISSRHGPIRPPAMQRCGSHWMAATRTTRCLGKSLAAFLAQRREVFLRSCFRPCAWVMGASHLLSLGFPRWAAGCDALSAPSQVR